MLEDSDMHRCFLLDLLPTNTDLSKLQNELENVLQDLKPKLSIAGSLSTKDFKCLQIKCEKYIPTDILYDGLGEAIIDNDVLQTLLGCNYMLSYQITYTGLRLMELPRKGSEMAMSNEIPSKVPQDIDTATDANDVKTDDVKIEDTIKNHSILCLKDIVSNELIAKLDEVFPEASVFNANATLSTHRRELLIELPQELTLTEIVKMNSKLQKFIGDTKIHVYPAFDLEWFNRQDIISETSNTIKNIYCSEVASVITHEHIPLFYRPYNAKQLNDPNNINDEKYELKDIEDDPEQRLKDGKFDRLFYYEIMILHEGSSKEIIIGVSVDETNINDATKKWSSYNKPGDVYNSFGYNGENGYLSADETNTRYGPKITQKFDTLGCGFILRPLTDNIVAHKDDVKGNDDDNEIYTISNVFFTFNGQKLTDYPTPKATKVVNSKDLLYECKTLLTEDIMHKLLGVVSLKSEGAVVRFNFGPSFRWQPANEFVKYTFLIDSKKLNMTFNTLAKTTSELNDNEQRTSVLRNISDPKFDYNYSIGKVLGAIHENNENAFDNDDMFRSRQTMATAGFNINDIKKMEVLKKEDDMRKGFILATDLLFTPIKNMTSDQIYSLLVDSGFYVIAQQIKVLGYNGRKFLEMDYDNELDIQDINFLNDFKMWVNEIKQYGISFEDITTYNNLPPEITCIFDEPINDKLVIELWKLMIQKRQNNPIPGSLLATKQEFMLDAMAFYMTYNIALERMEEVFGELVHGRHNDNNSSFSDEQELIKLCSGVIAGSRNPISTAIQLASYVESLYTQFPEIKGTLVILSNVCQDMASNFVNKISSDRLALLALEAHGGLDIAIRNELTRFIKSPRVKHLRNLLWTQVYLMESCISEDYAEKGEHISWLSACAQCLTNPFDYYFSSIGKMQVVALIGFIYIVMVTLIVNDHIDVYQRPLTNLEWLFYISLGAGIIKYGKSMLFGGCTYLLDRDNFGNVFTFVLFSLVFWMRFIGYFIDPPKGFGTYEINGTFYYYSEGDEINDVYDTTFNLVFFICLCLIVIFAWLKITDFLLLFETLGALVRSMQLMIFDGVSVVFVFFIVYCGFALAAYLIGAGQLEKFGTTFNAFKHMYTVSLGELDWVALGDTTQEIQDDTETVAQDPRGPSTQLLELGDARKNLFALLLWIWAVIGGMILVTLVIAVLTRTYETVRNRSEIWVAYNRLKIARNEDKKVASLYPPLSIFPTGLTLIWFCIEITVFMLTGYRFNEELLISKNYNSNLDYNKYMTDYENKHVKGHKNKYEKGKHPILYFLTNFFITPEAINVCRAKQLGYLINYQNAQNYQAFEKKNKERGCCARIFDRFRYIRPVWNELVFELKAPDGYGGIVSSKNNNNKDDDIPIVWFCAYCRHNNNEVRRIQRQSKWDDFGYYVEWNANNNPVGYSFDKDDIAMLQKFELQLCDYCFRVRRWKHRNEIIEEMTSYFLFYIFIFILRIPLIVFYILYRLFNRCNFIRSTWKRIEQNYFSSGLYEVIIELERKGLTKQQQRIMKEFFYKFKKRALVKRSIKKAIDITLMKQRRAVLYRGNPKKCTEIAQLIRRALIESNDAKELYNNNAYLFSTHKSMRSEIIAKLNKESLTNIENLSKNISDMESKTSTNDDSSDITKNNTDINNVNIFKDASIAQSSIVRNDTISKMSEMPNFQIKVRHRRWSIKRNITSSNKDRNAYLTRQYQVALDQSNIYLSRQKQVVEGTLKNFKYISKNNDDDDADGNALKRNNNLTKLVKDINSKVDQINGQTCEIKNQLQNVDQTLNNNNDINIKKDINKYE